jgi:hypothetical protein
MIVARGLRIALQCREPFGKLLATGLSFAFALQVFTIIGGVNPLAAADRADHPFMSQGGSSLICNWIVAGLLLVISHQVRRPARRSHRPPRCRANPAGQGERMNKPIRRVAFVAMLMFAMLLANGTYMMIFRQESLDAQPQNRRVRDAEFAQNRGAILATGKVEMAKTVPSNGSLQVSAGLPGRRALLRRSRASTPMTGPARRWRAPTTPNWPAPTTHSSYAG